VALRQVEGACHTDYMWRASNGLYSDTGLPADLSVREIYMAESVRWHLDRSAPGTRIVLAAHNNHIQKTPLVFDGNLTVLSMGHYLHRMLDDDYLALAVTSTADHTAEMYLDKDAPDGFSVADTPLDPPESGSVEAAVVSAGCGLSLADLRQAPRGTTDSPGLDRIRTQSTYIHTSVRDAFDAVLTIPTMTIEANIAF